MPRVLVSTLAIALASLGCAAPEAPESTRSTSEPIINGSADTVHDAVVAVLWIGSQYLTTCTGTIVATNPTAGLGYVLTAAHCCDPQYPPSVVRRGNDWKFPSAEYDVTSYLAHTGYNFDDAGSPYDFCMVTFAGATSSTPVIPAMAPAEDTMQPGTVLDFVGYGDTTGFGSDNSRRNHIPLSIFELGSLQFDYDVSDGGTCQGDSGGPGLANVNGQLRVGGVTSFGEEGCGGLGFSGRTSAVYHSFIVPYTGQTATPTTCDQCVFQPGNGGCSAQFDACEQNPDCVALRSCVLNCAPTDVACAQGCRDANAAGAGLYASLDACFCGGACASLCQPECTSWGSTVGFEGTGSAGTASGGGDNGDSSSDNGENPGESGGCGVVPASGSPGWAAALAALGALVLGRRRRGSNRTRMT
jgi:MYXO-CTERM domain-containing protein